MVGDTIASRYEVEELIGSGGMSSVYKAYDALLERHVALKILHEEHSSDREFVARFRHEARSAAQLSHPNIVTVIDRGEDEGCQYIVFEYIEGETLKELVVRKGRLQVGEALEIAIEIAGGLSFAHQQGLIHRDVKPQNVLLNGDGQAKVTDFGIARSLNVSGLTQTGTVFGTSSYVAPEQASGGAVDVQTDVYSLGIVLFELLTGDVPFPGDNFVTVAMKHVHEEPPDLRDLRKDVPPRVANAVDRALAKDPGDRFPTMAAFARELGACLAALHGEEDTGATLVVPSRVRAGHPPRQRAVSRWPLGIAALALLALAAIAVGLLALRGDKNPIDVLANNPSGPPIELTGVQAWDPYGDSSEHDDRAPLATDGSSSTGWNTEHYRSFSKQGVGLVLDAGRAVEAALITVVSDTPGFTAEIRAGSSKAGPFQTVSSSETATETTKFALNSSDPFRYFVVWITELPPDGDVVDLNEVRAQT